MKIRLFIHILLVLFMIIYILLLFHSMMQKSTAPKMNSHLLKRRFFCTGFKMTKLLFYTELVEKLIQGFGLIG